MPWQREPYPAKEKWTPEQERAYAEGRKSAQGEAGASRSGGKSGKRKRYVKTAAGERRYGQPIGTEIGNPRNKKAAEAQRDTESAGRYGELVGADKDAQAKAMKGLSDDQLQRLSQVAYSFRSSNPDVVRLRIGVANELARRGFNVNDFGGLGRGSAVRSAGPAPVRSGPAVKKAPSKYTPRKPKPTRSAMSARKNDRRLRELSVPQLRKAVSLFSRIPQGKRQAVARVLVRQAIELSAPHFLPESVIEAANLPDETRTRVIELAGKWRHGWIPLDGTALASKMKGKTGGKRWWDSGSGKGGTKGNLHAGIGISKNKLDPHHGRQQAHDRMPAGAARNAQRNRNQGMRNQLAGTRMTNVGQAPGFAAQKRNKSVSLKPDFTPKQRRDIAYSQERIRGNEFGKQRVVRNSDTEDQFGARKRSKNGPDTGKREEGGEWPRGIADDALRTQYKQVVDHPGAWSPKEANRRRQVLEAEMQRRGLPTKRKPGVKGGKQPMQRSVAAGNAARARRSGTDRTTVVKSGPESKEAPKVDANRKRELQSKPTLPRAIGTLGNKVTGAPAGYQAYSVKDTSLHDTALFDGEGNLVGFVKKRSGSSRIGRSGSATSVKNTGYTIYDPSGRSLGIANTRGRALDDLVRRSPGKA